MFNVHIIAWLLLCLYLLESPNLRRQRDCPAAQPTDLDIPPPPSPCPLPSPVISPTLIPSLLPSLHWTGLTGQCFCAVSGAAQALLDADEKQFEEEHKFSEVCLKSWFRNWTQDLPDFSWQRLLPYDMTLGQMTPLSWHYWSDDITLWDYWSDDITL